MRAAAGAVALLLAAATARAEPITVRLATVVPEGTAYARELHALSREVEAETHGRVRVKWYMNGVAGDELAILDRIRRGQLDGFAGALACQRISPTMRAMHVIGLAQNARETRSLLQRLRSSIDEEFERAGMVHLASASLGRFLVFSRTPLTDLRSLRRARLAILDLDDVLRMQLGALDFHLVPLPIAEFADGYDRGLLDGVIAPPSIALAFQWSARANYFTDLGQPQLTGCGAVTRKAFDSLSFDDQQVARSAAAKALMRVEDVLAHQDAELVGRLLPRQGLKAAPLSAEALAELLAAARNVRDRFDERIVPHERLARVLGFLSDLRADARDAP